MLTGDETVSMNMWGFSPAIFRQLREQFERFLETQGGDVKSECYLPNTVNALIGPGQAGDPGRACGCSRQARTGSV